MRGGGLLHGKENGLGLPLRSGGGLRSLPGRAAGTPGVYHPPPPPAQFPVPNFSSMLVIRGGGLILEGGWAGGGGPDP